MADLELDDVQAQVYCTYFPFLSTAVWKAQQLLLPIFYTKKTAASSLSPAARVLWFKPMAAKGEVYQLAFPPTPKPHISTGLPFPAACAHHITNTYHASQVYVIVSSSISKTDKFTRLQQALGDKIVGVRRGGYIRLVYSVDFPDQENADSPFI